MIGMFPYIIVDEKKVVHIYILVMLTCADAVFDGFDAKGNDAMLDHFVSSTDKYILL